MKTSWMEFLALVRIIVCSWPGGQIGGGGRRRAGDQRVARLQLVVICWADTAAAAITSVCVPAVAVGVVRRGGRAPPPRPPATVTIVGSHQ
jgi:hypothetical protein